MSERRLILIIDDDASIVKGIQLRLQKGGFDTIAAYNGRTGVELAIEKHPDLILMDSQMPVIDGFGALALLKAHADVCGIPVVMASGEESSHDRAMSAGAAAFLSKPFDGKELLRLVDELTLTNCEKASVGI